MFRVKLPQAEGDDRRLTELCEEVAGICCSDEFKRLHKEMSKLYRKSGVPNASRVAFQDSLFSLYLEQVHLERDEHPY
jgi:hypothetical protein